MSATSGQTFAIVGAGLAAGTAVAKLRDSGFDGRIVLFGHEQHLPYERPPMSKGYLMGTEELESAFVDSRAWYGEHDVNLRLGTPVTAIDQDHRTVTAGEHQQGYGKLLVATGASPRHLPIADGSEHQ